MSVDKRSTFTDALATLGTIIGDNEKRDAIHLAVEPVIAAHPLRPGDHVGFISPGCAGMCGRPLGIVDPFLSGNVKQGQRFWLIVYPRQITSLRHVWEHPSFPTTLGEAAESSKAASEQWLRGFAKTKDMDYTEMLERAERFLKTGDYWIEGGRFESEQIYGDEAREFWGHFEKVTSVAVPDDERENTFFSCSC